MGWARGMRGVCILVLAGTLFGISQADNSIFSGFLGCRFSSVVCSWDEECVDDRLFGNCQKANDVKDFYQYRLNHDQLKRLEGEITRLLGEGFTWDNLYTQCTLGNMLLAFRSGYQPDPNFCDNRSIAKEQQISKELVDDTLKLLEKYFVDYYDDLIVPKIPQQGLLLDENSVPVDGSYPPQSSELDSYRDSSDFSGPFEKKDEFVNVHKYLKSHKRDPFDSGSLEELDDQGDYLYDYDFGSKLDNLTPQAIDLLKSFLGKNPDYPVSDDDKSDKGNEDFSEDIPLTMDNNQSVDQEMAPQFAAKSWEGSDSPDIPVPSGMQLPVPIAESEDKDTIPAYVAMTPKDAKLLGDLLQGNIRASELPDKEIERLTAYVDSMLRTISRMDSRELDEIEQYLESEQDVKLPELHKAVKKEQMSFESLKTPGSDSKISVDIAPQEYVDRLKDPHDHHFDDDMKPIPTSRPKYDSVAANYAYLTVKPNTDDQEDAVLIVDTLESLLGLPLGTFSDVRVENGYVNFKVEKNPNHLNGSAVAVLALSLSNGIQNRTGFAIKDSGFGNVDDGKVSVFDVVNDGPKYFVLTFVLCGVIAGLVLAVIAIYIVRRHNRSRDKLAQLSSTSDPTEASKDYQDLCRQRMQSKTSEKPEPLHVAQRVGSVSATEQAARSPSSRSSTSSWSEEPVASNMDISTGHIVLSYMEDHLKNRDRLNQEWDALCAYEAEPNAVTVAQDASNQRKNRYSDVVPYDHSRVVLNSATNVSGSDYINASTITDHDPRNPAYIASQGPLPHTVADFWQMVWEQGSVVLVDLTKLAETGQALCHRYWPEEGSDLYHIYEVHLVSEHIWCDDYLVRSFYLKNLQTNETRTVTQFHFLTWPDLGVPNSAKGLLDFRRKVNKSYRGRSCPIVVHCSDGSGRTGTYCLIDMVLNRMSKGAKEIDIAASLEHIRDQRMQMVKTKEQFEFALASVAEEVHAILKALPQ